MWAVDKSLVAIAQLLLESGAEPSASANDSKTPLHLAAMEKNVEMIRLLLRFNADPCAIGGKGGTPLYLAFQNGPFKAAMLLIQKATDLNTPFHESMDTPLGIALNCCKFRTAEALIAAGADPMLANKKGLTLLHQAAYEGSEAITRLLLSKRANIFAKTVEEGFTPLSYALNSKSYPVTRLLVDNGSDLNVIDPRGGPLLHLAAFVGPPETVQMLLEKGLSQTAKDG